MKTKIKWMYAGHREAMKRAVSQTRAINKAGNLRRNYAAALYLLTGIENVWSQVAQYVNRYGINYNEGILKESFSSGEWFIIALSENLFNGDCCIDFTPIELIDYLNDAMFELAINGIILRRGNPTLAMLEYAPE